MPTLSEFSLPEIELFPCESCGVFTTGNPQEGVLCEECSIYFRGGFGVSPSAAGPKPPEPTKD